MSMLSTILRTTSVHKNFRKTSNLSYSVWKTVKINRGQNQHEYQKVLVNFKCAPNIHRARVQVRSLTTSEPRNKEPSSKIEETVERLKEKQKSASEVSQKEIPASKVEPSNVPPVITSKVVAKPTEEKSKVIAEPPKKSLWIRFKNEVMHYYSGFKLLFLDVQVSSKIVWKILRGKALTRRESRQLVRTTSVSTNVMVKNCFWDFTFR